MPFIEGPFKVNGSFGTHWLTFAEGGQGRSREPWFHFPGGRLQTHLSVWPLSESPLCLFTAVTVTGSGVGGAGEKKRKEKKVKREAAAGSCCSTPRIY